MRFDESSILFGGCIVSLALAAAAGAETSKVTVSVSVSSAVAVESPVVAAVTVTAGADELEIHREVEVPGSAMIEVLPDSTIQVSAAAPGWWARPQVVHVTSPQDVSVLLQPTGWIRGGLLVPEGEEIPAELRVRARSTPDADRELPETEWRCPVVERTFRCEVPHGALDLRLRAKSFVSRYLWGVEVPAHREAEVGVFRLQAGASVVGWVEAPSQAFRFDQVRVRLEPLAAADPTTSADRTRARSLSQEARLNARGFFEISSVAPGSYALVVEHAEYAPARIAPVSVMERAETEIHRVRLEPAADLEAWLEPPTDPFRGAWLVDLLRRGEVPGHFDVIAKGSSSPDGHWSTKGLAPGDYVLRVGDSRGARWASQEVRVDAWMAPVEVALPFDRLEGTLRLRGEPLAATLYFGGRHGERRIPIRSDDEGKFYVFLPRQGDPWVADVVAREPALEVQVTGIEVRRLPGELWAKVAIDLPAARVAGEVVDEAGAPVSGVLVEAITGEGGRPASVHSSPPDGRFELNAVEPGRYWLQAEHSRNGRELSSERVSVEVDADVETDSVRLVLREHAVLEGLVLSPTGQGVPGALVLARTDGSERPLPSYMPSATSDVDGVFELSLPRGTRRMIVSVMAPGFALAARVVDAEAAGPLLVELGQTGGTLVVSYSGGDEVSPLLRRHRTDLFHPHLVAPSAALRQWAELYGEDQQDPGRYVVPMLEPGPYTACYDVGFGVLTTGWLPQGGFSDRCASGVLAPHGELHLTLPVPEAAREPPPE